MANTVCFHLYMTEGHVTAQNVAIYPTIRVEVGVRREWMKTV